MPSLWSETVESHRREVRDAIVETTARLVGEHGLRAVTMSQIAETTGIGRATLYKYFPDVEAILREWHQRQITRHLQYLAEIRDDTADPSQRLQAVLEAFAFISRQSRGHHDTELAAFFHRDHQVAHAQRKVRNMIRDLIIEAAATGEVRDDVPPDELAVYCIQALKAVHDLPSKAAVQRLVTLIMDALAPP